MSSLSRSTPRKRVPYLLLTGIIIPLICLVPFSTGVYAEETDLPIASTTYSESEPASEGQDVTAGEAAEEGMGTEGSESEGDYPNVYYGVGFCGAGNCSANGDSNDYQYITAFGYQNMYYLTTGDRNASLGYQALFATTTGSDNTGLGYRALYSNNAGGFNTAVGASALYENTSGDYNIAVGNSSMYNNTTGVYSVAKVQRHCTLRPPKAA